MLTVLPLTVFAFVQSKETVSLVYTLVSLAAFSISFAIPSLVRRISRRWTYTLGAGLIGLCGALVALGAGWAAPFALLARTTGTAMLNITLSLYIMDNIDRRELVRSEPLRLGIATLAWTLMPYAGVLLMERFGPAGPGLLCLGLVAALLAAFWALGLREIGPARPGVARPANPIRTIGRFVAQPRLRLAWAIAFARSCFWVTFFVYVPILLVEGGQGPTAAAAAVAAANLMLFNNLYMRRVAARLTLRRTLAGAFLGAATLTAAAALGAAAGNVAAAAAAMVAGAFFTATIDGLGPIPFLRAVHSYERAQMTTVYRTYLDASDLLPPAVYFVVFMAFGFAGAFAVLAALLGYVGWLTWRHLPRGM
jgi:MFS family permease